MPMRNKMNPDLERLIRLQQAETDLRRVEAELAEVPGKRAELDAGLARERGRLDQGREAQAQSQKARRQHEADLQDLEAKRSRYKGQLMEVKTNKEYTAMLHEIEGVEREIRAREDQILAEMEKAEALSAEVRAEEEAFKAAEGRAREGGRALDARAATLEEQRARLAGERDAVAATVPGEVLELFQRVARLRGVAVAEARDGMCQVCHLKLRPQMFVDIKRNEDVLQCPACNRILYYATPPAAAGAEP
jgi:predicted  nucleic acid-binding Zn-ribbon protein